VIRVLHILDKLSMDGQSPSSVAGLLGDWVPYLAHHDVHCSVSTVRDPDPGADYLEARGIRIHRIGLSKHSPRNLFAFARLLRAERADIVHLHGFACHDFGRPVSRRLHVMNVVHEHATLQVPAYQRLADRLLRNWTDAAIAVSGSVRDFMVNERYVPPDRVTIIGNSVNLDRFSPGDEEAGQRFRRELDVPSTHRIVGVVGRLRAEKGVEFFVRAAPIVLAQRPDTTFVIAGEGPLRGSLDALADGLGVARNVRFVGFRSDVPEVLSAVDVLVVPSLTEGFPLSLIEGFAAGCPVVATRVGGIPEIAEDGINALLVPAEDPAAIARRVLEIIESPDRAATLSRAARQKAGECSVPAAAARVAALYRSLVHRSDLPLAC
jgi:glycosyltransferase involved in cell wall biosynthesis